MEILSAILCDAASDYSGKLCILGAFDTISVQQFPVVHAHCALAVRVLFHDQDEGMRKFSFKLIDSDGKNLLPRVEFQVQVKLREDMFFISQNFVINLQGLQFQKAGQYSIDISCDDKIVSRVPLQVVLNKPATES